MPPLRRHTYSAGDALLPGDLAIRGVGTASRGPRNVARIIIPAAGVDAPVETQTVGLDGRMPEPSAADVIAWYDFSVYSGIGGLPLAGGNAVFAGDIDRTGVGPGVFWTLHEVAAGDIVTLVLLDGRALYYHVEFNKIVGRDIDFGSVAAATADESATFITATGAFGSGGYADRRIVWARRVNCEPGGVACELPT